MSGQGLTCLGHGTFTNSGQLCSGTVLCSHLIMLSTCCSCKVKDLVGSADIGMFGIFYCNIDVNTGELVQRVSNTFVHMFLYCAVLVLFTVNMLMMCEAC